MSYTSALANLIDNATKKSNRIHIDIEDESIRSKVIAKVLLACSSALDFKTFCCEKDSDIKFDFDKVKELESKSFDDAKIYLTKTNSLQWKLDKFYIIVGPWRNTRDSASYLIFESSSSHYADRCKPLGYKAELEWVDDKKLILNHVETHVMGISLAYEYGHTWSVHPCLLWEKKSAFAKYRNSRRMARCRCEKL